MLPLEQKREEEKKETNWQSCPPAHVRNLRPRTQRDRGSKRNEKEGRKRRWGRGGAGVRSSIKVQLCNFIPVPAQWGMRLSSIWTCSRDLLTSIWGALCNTHTHTRTQAHMHAYTHLHTPGAPHHVSTPPGKSGVWRQVSLGPCIYSWA